MFFFISSDGEAIDVPKTVSKSRWCFVFQFVSPRTVTANRVSMFVLYWARTAKSRVGAGPVGTKVHFRYCRPQYRLPLLWPGLLFWDLGISSFLYLQEI
jgi:hypothetical protein